MSDAVVFKQSLSIALLSILHAILLPACSILTLYVCQIVLWPPVDRDFVLLLLVVAALSVGLLQPRGEMTAQLSAGRGAMTLSLLLRWLILLGLLLTIGYVTRSSGVYARRVILTWAVVTPVVMIVMSMALFEILRRVMSDPANMRRVIFAGCNDISIALAKRLQGHPELCMSVAGFFDDRSPERLGTEMGVTMLGKLPEIAPYVKQRQIDVIFIALPIRHVHRVLNLVDELRDTTASIYFVPDIFVFDLIQAQTRDILGIPVVAMCETPFAGYRGVVKRSMDIAICLVALPLLVPVMLVVALLIALTSPGPIIFRQRRYGLDGDQIIVYKFRTMTVVEDGPNLPQATKDDKRVTPIGRLLRRYSLDELPQLVNVLQGRMSLVGPRPHAVAHNEEYRKLISGYMIRHKVRPGITGWAQINGLRGETSTVDKMHRRVQYDLDYLKNWSLWLDLKIIARTALTVVSDRNAY